MNNKKVLICVDWFYPGFGAGGPIRSVINFISYFKDRFDFFVFTRNHDYCKDKPYEGIKSDSWTSAYDGAAVYYVSRKGLSIRTTKKILLEKDYKVVFLNSFFSLRFTILPIILLKMNKYKGEIILAPRGMLLTQALSHKAWKKRLYIATAKILHIYNGITWMVTSKEEEKAVKKMFKADSKIIFFPNIPPKPPEKLIFTKKEKGKARFIFNSRIHKHKNLLRVLRWLGSLDSGSQAQLDIYGIIEDQAYWQACKRAIDKLPDYVKVLYCGVIDHNKLLRKLSEYHFMILPTKGENFGYSIIEFLSRGRPVVISDRTRWHGLEKAGAGWEIPLADDKVFIKALQKTVNMRQREYNAFCKNAHNYARYANKEIMLSEKYIKKTFN